MNTASWVLIASEAWRGALAAVQPLGGAVTAVVVGPRGLADDVAAAGPGEVLWLEPADGIPAEAYAGTLAGVVAAAAPGARCQFRSDRTRPAGGSFRTASRPAGARCRGFGMGRGTRC